MRRLPLLVSLPLLLALPAAAQEVVAGEAHAKAEPPAPARNYANLRVGGSTGNSNNRPEICLELSPLEFLAVESCGTGSGLLHSDPLPEVMHLRGKLRLMSFENAWGTLQPLVAAGFAELQIGEDDTGFQFGGTNASRVSTSGLELGVGLRYLRPLTSGFELVGDLGFSMAWMPHAPELVRPQEVWLPSASLSVGVGF
jgi:hypothetical protein